MMRALNVRTGAPGERELGLVLRLFGRGWTQRIGVLGFLAFVLAAIFAPLLTPYDPIKLDATIGLRPPSLPPPAPLSH